MTKKKSKYKLAREGEKGKEKDEDIEKGKDFYFFYSQGTYWQNEFL